MLDLVWESEPTKNLRAKKGNDVANKNNNISDGQKTVQASSSGSTPKGGEHIQVSTSTDKEGIGGVFLNGVVHNSDVLCGRCDSSIDIGSPVRVAVTIQFDSNNLKVEELLCLRCMGIYTVGKSAV